MIPQEYIQEVVRRNDIEEVIGQYVQLRRRGRTATGLCPFHNEKTPSFVVYPDTQSFYCFGCGAAGDVINFVRKYNNLGYVEAVKQLAGRAGMPLPEEDDRESRARQLAVAMLQDPEQVPYVRARLDMSTVLVPEMQRALEAIFRCVDEHLPLNQTSLQQMLDEAAFQQLAHGQAYNHDIRLQRQDIDMYLDRLQTAKPISEQVKDMSDGQLESYFANLGKKKGARPAETDE